MEHQLHSSTATGGLAILNFDLRLLWACSQALNTFKRAKPPGLLRPECLHHGLLQPFPDTAGTLQHPSVQSLGLFAFARRTSASFSLLMLTGLSAISSLWGMLTHCQGPGIASYQLLMRTWQSCFHEHPKIQNKLCWRKDSASKDLAQTSYFMATNSLHLTTFCLQYKPTVIACVCIHLACKWSNWEIPVSTDGKHWWEYVDPSVTLELLDELTHEFLQILEKTPSRLKRIRNWRANQAAKKPKGDGQVSENSLLGSSLVQNSILVDTVTGVAANTSFQKPSTSFPAPVPLTSGSISVPDSHAPENLAILTTGMPSTSYSLASHQEWPQHQEQTRTEQIYSQKQETLPASQYNMNFQAGASVQLHSGVHHRADKLAEHSTIKQEYSHKSANKHHGQVAAPVIIPQKMSLDKYREKRKLETLELDVREHYVATPSEQQHKKHLQPQAASSSVTSPIKMKIPIANAEKPEKHLSDKKEKGGSLKLRIPIPPTEKGASKEELKMKIKVSSSERHSSSDEGSGKSKHSSPHVSKEHKDKHKEHSLNRHHGVGHKHSHSHGGGGSGSSKHSADGVTPSVLRSPVGLSSDGNSSSSGSSRKKLHSNDASHNHHSKMSKSSKSSGGLRTSQHPRETGQETSGERS
ncbi:cyclin-T2 isoform X3 [Hirundo rustica]|uniref:cyclin-T2 isoform X3 n=1 Tax=Hirundo rustica TaxID=43150 RepID=UPI002670FB29|nr:cyclin-T2 isoform X3 [Hirundo rustica]